jgi:hypothetical protein
MAAIITESIPLQGFEFVEKRVAEILLEELTNQKAIQGLTSDFDVFLERQEPYSESEDVVVMVYMHGSEYQGFTKKDMQGVTTFFIDVYAGGEGSVGELASVDAKDKLNKYVGMIRYILSSAKYATLGFPAGLIGGKYVEEIKFDTAFTPYGNHSNYDAGYIRFSRTIFTVRIQENQDLWTGIPLQGNDTIMYLNEGLKGTKLTFNN